mmetsp:Transcript_27620/g.66529  ORF Transcript_27620/g.66529 Transcript_27620/m.66529 type:complete len:240 (-) Transcript_27620:355-1074(-)
MADISRDGSIKSTSSAPRCCDGPGLLFVLFAKWEPPREFEQLDAKGLNSVEYDECPPSKSARGDDDDRRASTTPPVFHDGRIFSRRRTSFGMFSSKRPDDDESCAGSSSSRIPSNTSEPENPDTTDDDDARTPTPPLARPAGIPPAVPLPTGSDSPRLPDVAPVVALSPVSLYSELSSIRLGTSAVLSRKARYPRCIKLPPVRGGAVVLSLYRSASSDNVPSGCCCWCWCCCCCCWCCC